jgi:hypothetical protein
MLESNLMPQGVGTQLPPAENEKAIGHQPLKTRVEISKGATGN